ncbi:MAG: hypothetical protein FIB01_12610 [Gemmatimonadetes bacterium]|nr:hypothetical protein [Gemmatimonadota bacterium]
MNRALLVALASSSLLATALAAQAPTIAKVEPPNWWADHSINPVRLLIRGRHLAGARLECPRFSCTVTGVSPAGTYAFADVVIPRGTPPGSYPLTLRTAAGSAPVPFAVSAPLPPAVRFQGFNADDVIYLIMPDRFANGSPANDEPAVSQGILDRTKGRRYHGGDLQGVRQRLPYLKDLGITAIWLNPIYDNTNTLDTKEVYDGQATTAYHG